MAELTDAENRKKLITDLFIHIGTELNERHRKTDSIYGFSRQITWESKRVISGILGSLHNPASLRNVEQQLNKIVKFDRFFTGLAYEFQNEDKYYYYRCYTSALQEFVEAFALLVFVKEGRLLMYEEVVKKLTVVLEIRPQENSSNDSKTDPDVTEKQTVEFSIPITKTDFHMGISDVPGELVRACASGVHRKDFKQFLFQSCALVRSIHQCFSRLLPAPRGLHEKLMVMRTSLCKLETACYQSVIKLDRLTSGFCNSLKAPIGGAYYVEEEDSGYDM